MRAYLRLALRAYCRSLLEDPLETDAGADIDRGRAGRLAGRALRLADDLEVQHLELRHEQVLEHPALTECVNGKVHMRLALPATANELWDGFPAKVRNQVRKGRSNGLKVAWGGEELLPEFYAVFSHNMRDLGTPVYGRGLFRAVLEQFPDRAELCVVRAGRRPAAARRGRPSAGPPAARRSGAAARGARCPASGPAERRQQRLRRQPAPLGVPGPSL
jgi:hypothetical protein